MVGGGVLVGGGVDEKVYICAKYEGNLILILALDLVAPKIILAIGFGFFVCACVHNSGCLGFLSTHLYEIVDVFDVTFVQDA